MAHEFIDGVKFEWSWKHRLGPGELARGGPRTLQRRPIRANAQVIKNREYYEVRSRNLSFVVKMRSDTTDRRRFRFGICNTIFHSERNYYYRSSLRTRVRQYLEQVPVWDGDSDDEAPWYDGETEWVRRNNKSCEFYFADAPACQAFSENPKAELRDARFGWERDPRAPNEPPSLFCIDGHDSFAAYLCIQDTRTGVIHPMCHIPWSVTYRALIRPETGEIAEQAGAVTRVGVGGLRYADTPALDGHSCEHYDRGVIMSWNPGSLPTFGRDRMRRRI